MEPEQTTPLTGRRVLIVEDEYLIADDLQRVLHAQGAAVAGPVAEVAEALALIAGPDRIDGVVLDINLGGEVADALVRRGVPFVFATGYDWGTIPPRFAEIVHCEKPVEPDCVVRALFG